MKTIFHITQAEKWERATILGSYRVDSLEIEGFIHCSQVNQIVNSANKFFFNQQGLVLLFIDAAKVKAEVRYEEAEIGELFPHIYGELNIDAVFGVSDFEAGEDGLFNLPLEVVDLE